MGTLFAFALLALAAGPCLAQYNPWDACAPIPKYPAFMPTGPGSWRVTSTATQWRSFPPPPGGYTDRDITTQTSHDSPEQIKAWFAAALPGWNFEAYMDDYPPTWQFLQPNSKLGVIIYVKESPIVIQYKCM